MMMVGQLCGNGLFYFVSQLLLLCRHPANALDAPARWSRYVQRLLAGQRRAILTAQSASPKSSSSSQCRTSLSSVQITSIPKPCLGLPTNLPANTQRNRQRRLHHHRFPRILLFRPYWPSARPHIRLHRPRSHLRRRHGCVLPDRSQVVCRDRTSAEPGRQSCRDRILDPRARRVWVCDRDKRVDVPVRGVVDQAAEHGDESGQFDYQIELYVFLCTSIQIACRTRSSCGLTLQCLSTCSWCLLLWKR